MKLFRKIIRWYVIDRFKIIKQNDLLIKRNSELIDIILKSKQYRIKRGF